MSGMCLILLIDIFMKNLSIMIFLTVRMSRNVVSLFWPIFEENDMYALI